MIPFQIPEWLQNWATIKGYDWMRWSLNDALFYERVARADGWIFGPGGESYVIAPRWLREDGA